MVGSGTTGAGGALVMGPLNAGSTVRRAISAAVLAPWQYPPIWEAWDWRSLNMKGRRMALKPWGLGAGGRSGAVVEGVC
jgi:hypothetical protein